MNKLFVAAMIALALLFAVPAQADPARWLAARVDAVPGHEPVFVASYDVVPNGGDFDSANANAAYTYDQALAIMACVASGQMGQARRIGDALVYAQDHDRFWHDGRLRNAYAAGAVGGGPVKLPGYYSGAKRRWMEDGYQAGSATGNNAWAGVALLRLADATGDKRYAESARRIGQWLIDKVGDGATKGLRGGFEDFEPQPTLLTWRSTEHNVAALTLFRDLDARFSGQGFAAWAAGESAFVQSMWSGARFEVGTLPDGISLNTGYSSLDAQILALLALPRDPNRFEALRYAEHTHGVTGGFDYSDARQGIWAEGTGEAATLYAVIGALPVAAELIAGRAADADPAGGVYAISGVAGASLEQLATGLKLGNGGGAASLFYFRRVAVAPAAWLVMAQHGWNPLAAPAK